FATKRDFVITNELADVLKADRRLERGLAVSSSGGIDKFGCGDAASRRQFPPAGLDEIVVHQRENQVGLHPRTVRIDDAETIGVAVRGEAGGRFGCKDKIAQWHEVFLADVGTGPVEEHIAVSADGFYRNAVLEQNRVEVA